MKTMRKLVHRKNVQPSSRKIKHVFPSINGYNPLSDAESAMQPLLQDDSSKSMEKLFVHEKCLENSERLEKDVSDLRENIIRIESRFESYINRPPPKQMVGAKLDDLEHKVVKLELEKMTPPKLEVATEEMSKYSAAIEKKTTELEGTIAELRSLCLNIKETSALADTVIEGTEVNCLINKLICCMVVLIFVICFQIGNNL